MSNTRRNRFSSWYIGAAFIIAGVLYLGEKIMASPAPTLLELGVLIVIPGVYLTLMYLTLKSQP